MFTGYNKEQIEGLRDAINSTAQEAAQGIVEKLESGIVTPMSTIWYAEEGVEFFEKFADVVKQSGTNIHDVFQTFNDYVGQAGANWAENTKGEAPTMAAIDNIELVLNVSAILNTNEKGDRGIEREQANSVADNLEQVKSEIETTLKELAAKLDATTSFLGGNQAEAVQNCFVQVSGEVHKIFNYLTEGDDSLRSAIIKTAEKYGEVGEGVSTAFSTQG